MVLVECNNLPQLAQTAETIKRVTFVNIASDPEMPGKNIRSLFQIDRLDVNSEQEVFETLSKWEEAKMKLLERVRFPLLSPDFIDTPVMTNLALSTLRVHKLLVNYQKFKFLSWGERNLSFFVVAKNQDSVEIQTLKFLSWGTITKFCPGVTRARQLS